MDNLDKRIEAVLFIHGEPVSLERLVKILGGTQTKIQDALNALDKRLAGGALTLVWHKDTVQLATRPAFAKDAQVLIKEEVSNDISRAASETLAVIAYKGSLPRSEIDYIRGVNSSYILRNLLIRGLIERRTNPKDSRTYIYQVSVDFLKFLGLSRIEELPEYAEFAKKFGEFLIAKPKEN
ncbi:MAG: SMC-Scp complex subunit ScpB [Candidatus Niyogibacteria bacterium]|nr:SMC-Scp complex subunit ScpB [Candidatus Niyogibacteria bacterium]